MYVKPYLKTAEQAVSLVTKMNVIQANKIHFCNFFKFGDFSKLTKKSFLTL